MSQTVLIDASAWFAAEVLQLAVEQGKKPAPCPGRSMVVPGTNPPVIMAEIHVHAVNQEMERRRWGCFAQYVEVTEEEARIVDLWNGQ